MSDAFHIRPMRRPELDLALQWAANEGWNPGRHDADAFWAADPEGYVVAECNGEMIGTGAIIAYGRKLGAMGLFIVREDARGNGLGRRLWFYRRDLLRSRLDFDASIIMDGVLAMQPFYSSGGFQYSHADTRREGVVNGDPETETEGNIVDLTSLPFVDVLSFDARHFGAKRESFLRVWIDPPHGSAKALIDTDGSIAAMGVIRSCVSGGWKIGPLFATDPLAADVLFRNLVSRAAGETIYLDTPDHNPAAVALADRHGLKPVFTCGRMSYGPKATIPWGQIYGVTTFELG
ncbi:GNAT family N-acetyltransferase [Stratiformator vulcanicus]|uniref:Acetyltransferase (GNAT) family protein n=1 Tax=Stratiformator vulcanicus TaxID=2527980 RepID=A0A517R617_9PLAN|nr:GNAT family N-acetyltransferase [Stratiformator vulcanicus]QDT39344.1 Acetyltransferase (GNAT) family protein [Stratiformator vulcanicus]